MFHFETNGQIKPQNNIIKVHFKVFYNYELMNQVKFLLIAKFEYKNKKNISITYMFLDLYCKYYS